MKPLSQMTREELWSLGDDEIWELYWVHFRISDEEYSLETYEARKFLETLRLELQQDNAEARRESLEDR